MLCVLILSLVFMILIFIYDASDCHISKCSYNISGEPCQCAMVTSKNV